MIYDYEANILKYIHKVCLDVKELTYAKERDFFNSFSAVTKYPAFLYYREEVNWEFPAVYRLLSSENRKAQFAPFDQTYVGRVYMETNKQIMDFANELRMYWANNSYLRFPWQGETLKVGLRLLYIKLGEDRNGADKKGAQRYVEFKWQSRLFHDLIGEDVSDSLVKEVRIFLTTEDTVEVYDADNNLIKTIK